MLYKFIKLSALKNDYILFDLLKYPNYVNVIDSDFVKKISERRRGIGADGVLFLMKDKDDLVFRIFNADGTEAEACANGLRVFFYYAYNNSYISRKGKLKLFLTGEYVHLEYLQNNRVSLIMDNVKYEGEDKNAFLYFSVPNPHIVIFKSKNELEQNKLFEPYYALVRQSNVNIITYDAGNITIRTLERGVGETFSCGTGAIASAVAVYLKHNTKQLKVYSRGGTAETSIVKNREYTFSVQLNSEVSLVFSGELDL